MLSMNDLIDYCDLDKSEIEAIAEHQHIPLPIAVELGEYLLHSSAGLCTLHAMIQETIQHAADHGRHHHAAELAITYQHLQRTHPLPSSQTSSPDARA